MEPAKAALEIAQENMAMQKAVRVIAATNSADRPHRLSGLDFMSGLLSLARLTFSRTACESVVTLCAARGCQNGRKSLPNLDFRGPVSRPCRAEGHYPAAAARVEIVSARLAAADRRVNGHHFRASCRSM